MYIKAIRGLQISLRVLFAVLVLQLMSICVNAEELIPANTLVEVIEDAAIKELADESSKNIAEVVQGTTMFTIDNGENGWYKVKIKKQEGYIQANKIAVFGGSTELKEEFDAINSYEQKIFNTIKDMEFHKVENIAWLIAMAVLIVITIAVGIHMSKKNNRNNEYTGGKE